MSDDNRTVEIRFSTDVSLNKEKMDFPFLFIQDQFGYSVNSIYRDIHSQTSINLETFSNTFPNTIVEFYWIKNESCGNAGQQWYALGRLENNIYFFYTAYCGATKTFLNKGGHMNVWVSRHYSDLIHYAMNLDVYKKYIDETSPVALAVATPVPVPVPVAMAVLNQRVTGLVSQTGAKSQMSRQALAALIESGASVPPVQDEQSPSDQLRAQELQ